MYKNRFSIGKIYIDITDSNQVMQQIEQAIKDEINGYICVSNMRTVAIANKDNEYHDLMAKSFMNIPDGMPLIWCARIWGIKEAKRCSGPDIFTSMLTSSNNNIKHFLLGDTEETLNKLKSHFPNANIVGTYSPPFKPLEEYNLNEIAKLIEDSKANIVWTSLRAPKQDFLGSMLLPHVHNKIFIGVGAAFRIANGEYKMPPEWVRKCGLSGFWLLRNTNVIKETIWYLKHLMILTKFIFIIVGKRIKGIKYYE